MVDGRNDRSRACAGAALDSLCQFRLLRVRVAACSAEGHSGVNGRVAGHSGEGRDDLGGQAFHVLGLVEERGEEDQVGAGLGHLARSTYAVLRRPRYRDR